MTRSPAEVMMELAERCEKAMGPDRKIDAAICRLIDLPRCEEPDCLPDVFERIIGRVESGDWDQDPDVAFYTASLDAAMTLVPEGWYWQVGQGNHAWAAVYENPIPPATRVDPIAATPALALCAAALRARATQESISIAEKE